MAGKRPADIESLAAEDRGWRDLADRLHQKQMERIRNGSSKTRLNILFYSVLGNAVMLSRQNVRLLEIFAESFGDVDAGEPFDLALTASVQVRAIPGGTGAAAVFGVPQDGLGSVLQRVKRDDRGRELERLIAERVDTTGAASLGGVGACPFLLSFPFYAVSCV